MYLNCNYCKLTFLTLTIHSFKYVSQLFLVFDKTIIIKTFQRKLKKFNEKVDIERKIARHIACREHFFRLAFIELTPIRFFICLKDCKSRSDFISRKSLLCIVHGAVSNAHQPSYSRKWVNTIRCLSSLLQWLHYLSTWSLDSEPMVIIRSNLADH